LTFPEFYSISAPVLEGFQTANGIRFPWGGGSPINIEGGRILFGIEYAMAQDGGAASGSMITSLLPFILIFVIMYFLIIRPQQKKQKEHREMIQNLKKGDRIITGGGIHGRVTGMDDATFTVEIADKVRVKINRGNVSAVVQPGGAKEPAAKK
jgi:preprotein translocase subunit YajC